MRFIFCVLCAIALTPSVGTAEDWQARRSALVEEIQAEVRATRLYTGRAALDERVMAAMERVPRHQFVDPYLWRDAYQNRPLPIGHGQTISQPYIVALMTDLLDPEPGDAVLEVGTGSGYQAAVLAELVAQVYTLEIVEPLAVSATRRLRGLGYDNVTVAHADGYYGWEDHAPFDAIIVTAVGGQIPPPLIAQLKPGGKMILPVGGRFTAQYLVLVTKEPGGRVTTRQLLPVSFVPLTGEH